MPVPSTPWPAPARRARPRDGRLPGLPGCGVPPHPALGLHRRRRRHHQPVRQPLRAFNAGTAAGVTIGDGRATALGTCARLQLCATCCNMHTLQRRYGQGVWRPRWQNLQPSLKLVGQRELQKGLLCLRAHNSGSVRGREASEEGNAARAQTATSRWAGWSAGGLVALLVHYEPDTARAASCA